MKGGIFQHMNDGNMFDTNIFFSGGAGMFIQYHDVVKPVYLYAIIKMIISENQPSYGLPISIIRNMSIFSIIEWYINRRYKNPLRCLDFNHKIDPHAIDVILQNILKDESIYAITPMMNLRKMLYVYRRNMMSFPIYVYSEEHEPQIEKDCHRCFQGIQVKYLHGSLEKSIKKCDQNFTYIFSDIELFNSAAKILRGTCSHVLLTGDYRYNYVDAYKTMTYDMKEVMSSNPFIRTGITYMCDTEILSRSLGNLIVGGKH